MRWRLGGMPVEHSRFPMLDGYRAIAALMVLTTHVAFNSGAILEEPFGPLLGRFDIGVTVFFLLSGFLLYRPWSLSAMTGRTAPRTRTYLLRRFSRVVPAYWVMVTFTLLLLPEIQPVAWQAWPVHLGLLHIYVPGFTLEGLTQTWSLATEVAFYLLLPVLAWVAGRRHRGDADASARRQLGVLAVAAAASFAFNALRVKGLFGDMTLSGYWILSYLDWFALGMILALAHARLTQPNPPRWARSLRGLAHDVPTCLAVSAAVFVISATPIAGPLTFVAADPATLLLKHYLFAVAAGFFLLPGFLGPNDGRWHKAMSGPVMAYLGTISYGIFLWHLVLLRLIAEALGIGVFQGWFWLLWISTVASAVLVASLSWHLLERPLQLLTHRPPRSTPRASADAVVAPQ